MLVKLLAPHFISSCLWETNTVLSVTSVTPLMQPLDDEAREAIAAENIRVFGRWIGQWPNLTLLDNPPIIRSLENSQPVPPIGASGGPSR